MELLTLTELKDFVVEKGATPAFLRRL